MRPLLLTIRMSVGVKFSKIWVLTLAVAAVVAAVHINTLGAGFFYDDEPFIVDNPKIRYMQNLPSFFTSKYSLSDSGHSIYRPLRTLSFAIDYAFWGLNPLGYHLMNLSLHVANSVAIFLLFRLIGGTSGALLAALAFGVHPVQTETVAWVSSRGDLLFSFFALLSFFFYIYRKIPLSLAFYALALLSKETAIAVPLAFISYDYCCTGGLASRKTYLNYALYAVIGLSYVLTRSYVLGEFSQSGFWGGSFARNIMAALRVFIYEIRLVFLPGQLRPIYTFSIPTSPSEPIVILEIAILASIVMAARKLASSQRTLLFFFLWFFIFLMPSSNIIPLKGLLSEHYLYFPLAGISMAAALIIADWGRAEGEGSARRKKRLWAFGLAIILMFAVQSARRNSFWTNEERLWSDSVRKSPSSYNAQNNLGIVYMRKGLYYKAISQFLEAIRLNPGLANAYTNLGVVYGEIGSTQRAEEAYKKALIIEPDLARAQSNLGDLYNKTGRRTAAKKILLKALQLEPGLAIAHSNLGVSFGEEGSMDKAMAEFFRALRSRADYAEAWNNLGTAYGALGLAKKAKLAYERALIINPLYAEPHYGLAAMYETSPGETSKANYHKEQWERLRKSGMGK